MTSLVGVVLSTFLILVLVTSMYGFYGILSAALYNPNIVISTNATETDSVIQPCLIYMINNTCPEGYYEVKNGSFCYEIEDVFGNYLYPNATCLLDKGHCTEDPSCYCLNSRDSGYLYDETNYVLIYIVISLVILVGVFALLIIPSCAFIAYRVVSRWDLIKKACNNVNVENETSVDIKEDGKKVVTSATKKTSSVRDVANARDKESDNAVVCKSVVAVVVWIIGFCIMVYMFVSTILLPCLLYSSVTGSICDYTYSECYYLAFEPNAIVMTNCRMYQEYQPSATFSYILLTGIVLMSVLWNLVGAGLLYSGCFFIVKQ